MARSEPAKPLLQNICCESYKTLDRPPSCVAFQPGNQFFVIVGTYDLDEIRTEAKLEEDGNGLAKDAAVPVDPLDVDLVEKQEERGGRQAQNRRGSLVILSLETPLGGGTRLRIEQTRTCRSAVLDLKFYPSDPRLLAVALSTGMISFYSFSSTSSEATLTFLTTVQPFLEDALVTSIAFHHSLPLLASTISTGEVNLFKVNSSVTAPGLTLIDEVHKHTEAAWTVVFATHPSRPAPSNENDAEYTLYSGGDDSALTATPFDWRPSFQGRGRQPTLRLPKHHESGVTAVLPLPAEGFILTGSFDEHVRLIAMNSRHTLTSVRIGGGGVWGLKQMHKPALTALEKRRPSDGVERDEPDNLEGHVSVLASCMHAGVRILDVIQSPEGKWRIDVLAQFTDHRSMAYAADCQPKVSEREVNHTTSEGTWWVVSASFYDRLCCVWKIQDGKERDGGQQMLSR